MTARCSTMILRDGRKLAWRDYGSGFPIVFCHGNLNSRLLQPSWGNTEDDAAGAGARVLAVDRPGYGESSVHSSRTYMSWADDVNQLVDHLNLESFGVMGFSSGGPHALVVASALKTSRRVACCGLISSDAPYFQIGGPDLVAKTYGIEYPVTLEKSIVRSIENEAHMRAGYEAMGIHRSGEDRRGVALADLNEAIRQGFEGAASDAVLESAEHWGFDLHVSDSTKVLLWHGSEDHDVPLKAGEYLAQNIGCTSEGDFTVIEGESHSLIRRHWSSILDRLVAESRKSNAEKAAATSAKL